MRQATNLEVGSSNLPWSAHGRRLRAIGGSIPSRRTQALVVQRMAQRVPNPQVAGSTPAESAQEVARALGLASTPSWVCCHRFRTAFPAWSNGQDAGFLNQGWGFDSLSRDHPVPVRGPPGPPY